MFLMLLAAACSSCCAVLCLITIGPQRVERWAQPLSLAAAGLLLTLAFAHLIPEALHEGADAHTLGLCALATVLILCCAEMLLSSGTKRREHSHGHGHSHALANGAGGLLAGTLLHTFCDGVMLAAAFAADVNLGLAVTAAVFAHELPQEIGDYALLLTLGFTRVQAFAVNGAALSGMVSGALLSALILDVIEPLLPYILAVSAASFIYVALSDLLPRLKHACGTAQLAGRLLCLLGGAMLAFIISHH